MILRKEQKNMGMTVNAMAGMQAASEPFLIIV